MAKRRKRLFDVRDTLLNEGLASSWGRATTPIRAIAKSLAVIDERVSRWVLGRQGVCAVSNEALQGYTVDLHHTNSAFAKARQQWWLRAMLEYLATRWGSNQQGVENNRRCSAPHSGQAQAATKAWKIEWERRPTSQVALHQRRDMDMTGASAVKA